MCLIKGTFSYILIQKSFLLLYNGSREVKICVIITAGGTGGHIVPALAIADKIMQLEPNSEILYIGTHNRMEKI